MPHSVVVRAGGGHADPWHPFGATSAALVELIRPLVDRIEVRSDVEAALADLSQGVDLLVLNLGAAGPAAPTPAAQEGLRAHVAAARPILAVHSTTTAYPGWGEWERLLGGRWVPDVTFHPEYGPARIGVHPAHPAVAGLGDFDTVDERYTRLRVVDDVDVLAWHELDGERHPLAWLRDHEGAPVAYVALGHDTAAYAASGTRALVRAAVRAVLPACTPRG